MRERKILRGVLRVLALGTCFAACCPPSTLLAADPTTRPLPTTNGANSFDLSDPKKAFETAMTAVMREDARAMKDCIYIPKPSDEAIVDAMVANVMANHRLAKAADARFGTQAKRLNKHNILFDDDLRRMVSEMAAGTISRGDNDVVFLETLDQHGMKAFKKTNSGWKMENVRFASDKDRDDYEIRLKTETEMMRGFTAQVSEGKFKTIEEAEAAYLRQRREADARVHS